MPFASSTGRPQWCLITGFPWFWGLMCSPVAVDFFFSCLGKSEKQVEHVIHPRSLFLIYWGYNTGLSTVKRSFSSDLGDTEILFSRLQIGMIPCYLCLTFAKSENFAVFCCKGGSHLVICAKLLLLFFLAVIFCYPKWCSFMCKLQK